MKFPLLFIVWISGIILVSLDHLKRNPIAFYFGIFFILISLIKKNLEDG
jgi:hypothetical protein